MTNDNRKRIIDFASSHAQRSGVLQTLRVKKYITPNGECSNQINDVMIEHRFFKNIFYSRGKYEL